MGDRESGSCARDSLAMRSHGAGAREDARSGCRSRSRADGGRVAQPRDLELILAVLEIGAVRVMSRTGSSLMVRATESRQMRAQPLLVPINEHIGVPVGGMTVDVGG